jgi:hypothetical protein
VAKITAFDAAAGPHGIVRSVDHGATLNYGLPMMRCERRYRETSSTALASGPSAIPHQSRRPSLGAPRAWDDCLSVAVKRTEMSVKRVPGIVLIASAVAFLALVFGLLVGAVIVPWIASWLG